MLHRRRLTANTSRKSKQLEIDSPGAARRPLFSRTCSPSAWIRSVWSLRSPSWSRPCRRLMPAACTFIILVIFTVQTYPWPYKDAAKILSVCPVDASALAHTTPCSPHRVWTWSRSEVMQGAKGRTSRLQGWDGTENVSPSRPCDYRSLSH